MPQNQLPLADKVLKQENLIYPEAIKIVLGNNIFFRKEMINFNDSVFWAI